MKALVYALIMLVAAPATVLACSPAVGYRVPTNIELLEQADLVVLARVRQGPSDCVTDSSRRFCFGSVFFETQRTLKGEVSGELSTRGEIENRKEGAYTPHPTELSETHPSSLWGSCVRQAYSEGSLVLAMFGEVGGEFRPLDHAFARSIEDVESADALWVRTAELYLSLLSENSGSDRRRAFVEERDRLAILTDDPEAQAIAADISRYLAATGND